jgi:hypothetical protein
MEAVVTTHQAEAFYAAAFWLFYSDYGKILPPAFGINAESHVVVYDDTDSPWSTKWVPAEWHWPVLDDACNALKPLYQRLSEDMAGASRGDWDGLLTEHDAMIASVARELTTAVHTGRGGASFPDVFVVAVLDDQREPEAYNALVRASIEPGRLAGLDGILTE